MARPEGRIPVQAPIPTGHTENTGEQDTLDQQTGDQDVGDITPGPASGDPPPEAHARPREEPLKVTVKHRLEREGRWFGQIDAERDEMMKLSKDRFKTKAERQAWVYSELDRLYPPLAATSETKKAELPLENGQNQPATNWSLTQVQGIADIPSTWSPQMPANASLASEVGWVQANRLRVVEEKSSGGTVVHLDQALSPAPSWAALGWLETSIRSYAKFVDVAAKATSDGDDESAVMRRERRSIEEVRAILDEMRQD